MKVGFVISLALMAGILAASIFFILVQGIAPFGKLNQKPVPTMFPVRSSQY